MFNLPLVIHPTRTMGDRSCSRLGLGINERSTGSIDSYRYGNKLATTKQLLYPLNEHEGTNAEQRRQRTDNARRAGHAHGQPDAAVLDPRHDVERAAFARLPAGARASAVGEPHR